MFHKNFYITLKYIQTSSSKEQLIPRFKLFHKVLSKVSAFQLCQAQSFSALPQVFNVLLFFFYQKADLGACVTEFYKLLK